MSDGPLVSPSGFAGGVEVSELPVEVVEEELSPGFACGCPFVSPSGFAGGVEVSVDPEGGVGG